MFPSAPTTRFFGTQFGVGVENSVIVPEGSAILPILLAASSTNHMLPSVPAVIKVAKPEKVMGLYGFGVGI